MSYNFASQDVQIQEEIGRGEFSTVYRANWNDKTIAVKKYSGPDDVFHLDITYKNLLRVDNEYILKLYGRTDIPGLNRTESLLLIEYADCGSLHDQMYRPMRRYNSRDALNWMHQCAQGMAFLHAMEPVPLVHYNLRPTMIFLTDYFQRLKISNKTINAMHPDRFWGPYDAPEGMRTRQNKEKFDVYSFGVVLWEVLSQQRPTSWEILEFIQTLSSKLVKSCLNFNPAKRPSMEAIITSIKSYMWQIHNFEINDLKPGEFIGSGAFGTVFKAHSRGIQYAIKEYNKVDEIAANTDIEREVKYLSQVNHKNIVKLFGLMQHTGFRIKIVMEFADCGTLYDYIHKEQEHKRSYTYLAALNWMYQLAQGLEYLHGIKPRAIIHRDIKTKNLLLSNNYRTLKIADFGTVTEIASMMTLNVGTAQYMAPEIIEDKKYTEKSDVYSFGIVFWEVMSQKIPFHHLENNKILTILYAVSKGKRPDINDIKDYPNRGLLIHMIENCWSAEAEKRYSMSELVFRLNIDLNSSDLNAFDIKQLAETSDSDYV